MDAPVVIVLASGRSRRFRAAGGQGNKLDADLCGRTVLERVCDAAQASGLAVHVERADHPGMGDSISAAVRVHPGAPGWLILPGDLPLVRPATVRAVAQALVSHPVVVPRTGGERGHPVGFAHVCGAALAALTGDRGAARVVEEHGAWVLDVDDPGCCLDVDTPERLEAARRLWRERA